MVSTQHSGTPLFLLLSVISASEEPLHYTPGSLQAFSKACLAHQQSPEAPSSQE